MSGMQKIAISTMVFISSFLIPISIILLLLYTSKIKSVFVLEKSERYIPYLFISLIYFIISYQFFNNQNIPNVYSMIFFIAGLNVFTLLIFLKYSMLSAHAISITSFLVLFYFLTKFLHQSFFIYFLALILILGFVSSSRLYLKSHSVKEVGLAVFIGLIINISAYYLSFKYGSFVG
jgi:hypothetical protein